MALAAAAVTSDAGQIETLGTLLGAGVLLGGLLGPEIGKSLDAADLARMAEAQQRSLEYERTGTTTT